MARVLKNVHQPCRRPEMFGKKSFWRGATSLSCPRRPHVSGRPCYQHAAVYGVFLCTVNWCTSSCLVCIPVLLFSRFRFCLLRFSYHRSKKKSHFVTNLKLYSFFWVIPRHLNFMCRRFGTLCSIFIGGVSTPKHPIERIQHSKQGESLKSRNLMLCIVCAAVQYTQSLTSTLLHNVYYPFTAPTCLDLRVWPSLGSYKLRRRTQHVLQVVSLQVRRGPGS